MNNLGLAVEAAKILTKADGADIKTKNIAGVKITDVTLSETAAKKIGKPAGRYITLEGERDLPQISLLLEKALREMIGEKRRILVVGLGNPDVIHDNLGAFTVRKIVPINNRKYSISAIETDVAAKTGVNTAKLVRGVARELRTECVLVIDALACENPRRIGKTVQLCNSGIVLASGAGKNGGELSGSFLGTDVVAVGVPTMTALSSISGKFADDYLVTAADIDLVVEDWSKTISDAINSIVL